MLAVLALGIPSDQLNYAFEYKWDGVRAIFYWDGQRPRLESRNQIDMTHRYPDVYPLATALGTRSAILDGEIIAIDGSNRPSFARLQQRMHVDDRSAIHRLVRQVPVCYMIFDLLYLDGRTTMRRPYVDRRRLLEDLMLDGSSWRVPPAHVGAGTATLQAAVNQQLEGVVAKKLDSLYEPGCRSRAWQKIKIVGRAEFVIGGWVPQSMTHRDRIGSLLLGYYEHAKGDLNLRYAGAVGTGFNEHCHTTLARLLAPLARPSSPFAQAVPKSGAIFVEPLLIAEVEYRRWPERGVLQQASFKGLRTDKTPAEVAAECVRFRP